MTVQTDVAVSSDGVPIQFDVHSGDGPALVFVHGWCCDRHYWKAQVEAFARHTAVCLDLAGHGGSGRNRDRWTVQAFGQDVVAVITQLGLRQVVAIGHSLGGGPIVEAARLLPDVVIGVIGIDAWPNLGEPRSEQETEQALAPLRADFAGTVRAMVGNMFPATADIALVRRMATAMSAADPQIGLAVHEAWRHYERALQQGLREIEAPKIAINPRPTPTDQEAQGFRIEIMRLSGVGHFLMIEDAARFNPLLAQAIAKCIGARERLNASK